MTDQFEKFSGLIREVEQIQMKLDELVTHVTKVKRDLEAARTPFTSVTGPTHFFDDVPHSGTIA